MATATHPFYTQDGWKDASELQAGDKIKTQNQENIEIKDTIFNYEPQKVYNFTVGNFHTYFVGALAWLVHNAGKCLSQLAKNGLKYAQDMLRGIEFNKIMSKKMGAEYVHELWTLGMKGRVDSFLKGGGEVISRKATQLAEITETTAKKYIDEIGNKYADKGVQNIERAGAEKLTGKKILQIPKQETSIPKDILDYADEAKVTIQEIKDVTMEMLKTW
ncbi:HINT domain-containing protein [Flavobacterium branchiophilum]|uniref:HINT domain-containing protein n=1 Tax=Flavobacterium branchiophilum TaxID=55197 RepID=UPI0021D27ADE|nr:HINT domain-containing protein [Flavobacterium branchiophilum]